MKATFASDNTAGVSDEIMAALQRANTAAAAPYGDDEITAELTEVARGHFGEQAQIWPVFNGTGANVVALQAALPRWGAVICSENSHIATDEGAAPERVGAIKLLTRRCAEAKLTPGDIVACASSQGFVHAAQPLAVSITQSTESGTLYSTQEMAALAETAHHYGMIVHVDGARLANAAAALDVSLRELTYDVGVDVLSLGGTKNGALAAEAVVVLAPERLSGTDYIRKYSMQLASKHRFISAQLLELLRAGLWHRNASHANRQARALGEGLSRIEGIRLRGPTVVNAVFAEMPQHVFDGITTAYHCHRWDTSDAGHPVARLMCAWNTSDDDVEQFVAMARELA